MIFLNVWEHDLVIRIILKNLHLQFNKFYNLPEGEALIVLIFDYDRVFSLHDGCPHSGEIHFCRDAIFSTEAQPKSVHVSRPCSILRRRLLIAKVSIIVVFCGFYSSFGLHVSPYVRSPSAQFHLVTS